MEMKSSVNKLKILIAIIFIFQGMSIALLSHPLLKVHPWLRLFGLGLMVLGIVYLYYHLKIRATKKEPEPETPTRATRHPALKVPRGQKAGLAYSGEDAVAVPSEQSIVTRIMYKLTSSAKNLSYLTLPIIGAVIIDAVFIYNFMTGQGMNFQSWDVITILLGASLIAYNFIPEQFSTSRDFLVFFLAILFIILVLPQFLYSFFIGQEASAYYTQIFLAEPVSSLLNVFGIESHTEIESIPNSGYTAMVYYVMTDGTLTKVGITESCSGIYTTSIFISAFITYILIEYRQINLKVIVILILGIFASYIANIFRMTIITGIGHYYGTQALLDAHANAGWLIFLAWIIPFWFLVFKFLMKEDLDTSKAIPD
jgi:archaeosortase C (PEF-CTERM variant)